MKNIGLMAKASAAALVLAAGLMTGCDSNGGGSSSKTGVFHDAVVSGISYTASPSGLEGVTDAEGKFKYKTGDTITFSIGNIVFPGGIPQDGIITPAHLAGTADWETDTTAINIIQFLLSIDEDGDATNGIQIPEGLADSTTVADLVDGIDFTDSGMDTVLDDFIADINVELTLTLLAVGEAAAEAHFTATIEELGITIEIQISTEAVPCSSVNTADIQGTWTGSLTSLNGGAYTGEKTIVVDSTNLTISPDEIDGICTYVRSVVTGTVETTIDTWVWTDGSDTYSFVNTEVNDVTNTAFTVTQGSKVTTGSLSYSE